MRVKKSIALSSWSPISQSSRNYARKLPGNDSWLYRDQQTLRSKDRVRPSRSCKSKRRFESQFHEHQKIVEHDSRSQFASSALAISELITKLAKANRAFPKTVNGPHVKIDQNLIATRAKIAVINRFKHFATHRKKARHRIRKRNIGQKARQHRRNRASKAAESRPFSVAAARSAPRRDRELGMGYLLQQRRHKRDVVLQICVHYSQNPSAAMTKSADDSGA